MVGRPLTEHELVERAREGDGHAYAALVRDHEEIAFRIAYVICGSAADAEEAAQEAFVKAYNALGRFRLGEPLRPWLLAIVANEARNRRRSAGRRAALALRAAGEERPAAEAAPSTPQPFQVAPPIPAPEAVPVPEASREPEAAAATPTAASPAPTPAAPRATWRGSAGSASRRTA